MTEDIFQDHHGVIDQPGEGERQPAKNHGVDGASAHVQGKKRCERRERDGKHYGDGGAHASQKDQDHECGEHQTDAAFATQILDGGFYVDGLIEYHPGDQVFRDIDEVTHDVLDPIDDRDGI